MQGIYYIDIWININTFYLVINIHLIIFRIMLIYN